MSKISQKSAVGGAKKKPNGNPKRLNDQEQRRNSGSVSGSGRKGQRINRGPMINKNPMNTGNLLNFDPMQYNGMFPPGHGYGPRHPTQFGIGNGPQWQGKQPPPQNIKQMHLQNMHNFQQLGMGFNTDNGQSVKSTSVQKMSRVFQVEGALTRTMYKVSF